MKNENVNDEYWINLVDCVSDASTCRVKIGTILIHKNIITGIGYVGSISGDMHCTDVGCFLLPNHGIKGSEDSVLSCERCLHAEMNAILKCATRGSHEHGWIICYSTYSPCLNCFKALLAIGVREFVFKKDYKDTYRDKYSLALHSDILTQIKWRKYIDNKEGGEKNVNGH